MQLESGGLDSSLDLGDRAAQVSPPPRTAAVPRKDSNIT